MNSSRHRRLIFGDVAGIYDEHRPRYPEELVSHILGLTRIDRAIEIGAGTGIATAEFARRGVEVICLEPSPDMARVLESKKLPGVSVEVSSFEDWVADDIKVDLIYAAQSWHWIDHGTGYGKVFDTLVPGGIVALFWNVPIDRYGRFVEVYQAFGPEILAENDGRIAKRDGPTWLDDLESAGFSDCDLFIHPWTSRLSAAEFRELCSTYSDHMLIPEPRRTRLLDALQEAVDSLGGWFEIEYEARVFTGRR